MSNDPAQVARLSVRLREIRDVARVLRGKSYDEEVKFMQGVLKRVQEQQRTDALGAAMWLARRVDRNDAAEKMFIFAAYVEMIEPIQQGNKNG